MKITTGGGMLEAIGDMSTVGAVYAEGGGVQAIELQALDPDKGIVVVRLELAELAKATDYASKAIQVNGVAV